MDVRKPAVAGMFYPASPEELRRDVCAMLDEAKPKAGTGRVVAAIVPHAGYPYSGPTAAAAFAALGGSDARTVVLVSPSHREHFRAISVYHGDGYATPLGVVEVDTGLRDRLAKSDPKIFSGIEGHRNEHAIEVQLPFVQTVLPGRKIVPVVMGDQNRDLCLLLGEKLAACLEGEAVVLVASSDLSHYYNYDVAEQLDQVVIDRVSRFDYIQLMNDLETEKTEACGGGPIVAVLKAAQALGGKAVRVLAHCNSGDTTGDRDAVVGYMSAIVETQAAD